MLVENGVDDINQKCIGRCLSEIPEDNDHTVVKRDGQIQLVEDVIRQM